MRAFLILVLFALMALPLVYAENDSLSQIFKGNDSDVIPPSVDEGFGLPANAYKAAEEARGAGMLAATAADSAGTVSNLEELKTLRIELKDVNTGQPIKNAHVRVTLDDGSNEIDTLRFVGESGIMELQIGRSEWSGALQLDLTSTSGKDYYASFGVLLNNDKNITVEMQPVGSVMGEVFDSANSLVPGATIKFECSSVYGATASVSTDEYGSFHAGWLPIGSCKISALHNNHAGSITTQIAHGQLSDVRITLEQAVIAKQDYSWVLYLAILVMAVAVLLVFIGRKRHKVVLKEETKEPLSPDKRMSDIVSALDENEKSIVKALMNCGGSSLQNKIGRELGLPKSSLSRAVTGLESRNLLKTEKLGRVKKVELSEWFLNGKKP